MFAQDINVDYSTFPGRLFTNVLTSSGQKTNVYISGYTVTNALSNYHGGVTPSWPILGGGISGGGSGGTGTSVSISISTTNYITVTNTVSLIVTNTVNLGITNQVSLFVTNSTSITNLVNVSNLVEMTNTVSLQVTNVINIGVTNQVSLFVTNQNTVVVTNQTTMVVTNSVAITNIVNNTILISNSTTYVTNTVNNYFTNTVDSVGTATNWLGSNTVLSVAYTNSTSQGYLCVTNQFGGITCYTNGVLVSRAADTLAGMTNTQPLVFSQLPANVGTNYLTVPQPWPLGSNTFTFSGGVWSHNEGTNAATSISVPLLSNMTITGPVGSASASWSTPCSTVWVEYQLVAATNGAVSSYPVGFLSVNNDSYLTNYNFSGSYGYVTPPNFPTTESVALNGPGPGMFLGNVCATNANNGGSSCAGTVIIQTAGPIFQYRQESLTYQNENNRWFSFRSRGSSTNAPGLITNVTVRINATAVNNFGAVINIATNNFRLIVRGL